MSEPTVPLRSHARPARRTGGVRRVTALRSAGLSLLLVLAVAGCTSADGRDTATSGDSTAVAVTGPLCDVLPAGTDPGNPASLVGEPVDVALQWIPVLTTFESALRASGLAPELRGRTGLTILAPTDDAFLAKFNEDTLDALFIERKDDLRALIEAHLVDGSHSLSDLVDAGTVTTLDGTKVEVTASGTMARVAGQADTLCTDYRAGNARIHIINKVLGKLPTDADGRGHRG
ncbi:fasciclin domain-containing protein [Micromonospora sp. NBC_01796]|uniref:fasciclin domain-containing protein n=1 Tax=Micromonospora sp. NBC_01796 TaxID=2975987 RepID=UPI002DD97A44|nr:fasciclin domain-containing protein [Micromonospora sp. NBC_01796]WSA84387.1 fasciclin domain-containing protein [Micromonospora sp. NBC_01796]